MVTAKERIRIFDELLKGLEVCEKKLTVVATAKPKVADREDLHEQD